MTSSCMYLFLYYCILNIAVPEESLSSLHLMEGKGKTAHKKILVVNSALIISNFGNNYCSLQLMLSEFCLLYILPYLLHVLHIALFASCFILVVVCFFLLLFGPSSHYVILLA
jgi:hypothetical protein